MNANLPVPGALSAAAAASRQRLDVALAKLPLVAILRGVQPREAAEIGLALHDRGFRLIEVPLNSPRPFESIAALRAALPAGTVLGAGTVLDVDDVARVRDAGGELVVMPHSDPEVIAAAKAAGMTCVPGFATPTEAFAALRAGADALKLFPAELVSPAALRAMRAVLPASTAVLPVGGIRPGTMSDWCRAGASGFGLGSALYTPGATADEVGARAQDFVEAWQACAGERTT
jgi:2-dehydro-3-deoxyphosphogalactonate aldolase